MIPACKKFVDALRDGTGWHTAARDAGLTPSQLTALQHFDEEFRAAINLAGIERDEQITQAIFDAASSGNVEACKLWDARRPAFQPIASQLIAQGGNEHPGQTLASLLNRMRNTW